MEFAVNFGRRVYCAGVLHYFVGQQELRKSGCAQDDHLEGLVVLVNPTTHDVITVYKNREAIRDIKKKSKLNFHRLPLAR